MDQTSARARPMRSARIPKRAPPNAEARSVSEARPPARAESSANPARIAFSANARLLHSDVNHIRFTG